MKIVLAGVLSTLLMTGAASALTVTSNCVGLPPIGLDPTELSGNISCPQFNLAGTLTSITLNFSGQVGGTITVTNQNLLPQSGSAETLARFFFGPLAGFTIGSPLFFASASTALVTIPSLATQSFGVVGSNSGSVVNTTNFGAYIGGGNFAIPVSTLTSLVLNFGGGQVSASQVTSARADATVTYAYNEITNVPEPTTLALLGTGLLGAAIRRRRQK